MKDNFFNEFDKISSKQWRQKIQYDLKGKDYNQSMVWDTAEGIKVKPFYHRDDFLSPPKHSTNCRSWQIVENIFVKDSQTANTKAKNAIKKGANSLLFILEKKNKVDFNILFDGINLETTLIFINPNFLSVELAEQLQLTNSNNNGHIYLFNDYIGHLVRNGNYYESEVEDADKMQKIISENKNLKSTICIDLRSYQNAGANSLQQLAYALSHACEYLNRIKSISTQLFCFRVSIGGDYFMEIAKLKALRVLWQSISKEFNCNPNCFIVAEPSLRNKTIYDFNNNLLRTTTECMSAVLGGADAIVNTTYDNLYHKENEFSSRIGRNQLLILKYESHFDKVENPTDGSYFIDNLCTELSKKSLELFKNIEKNGGFLKQFLEGKIQRKIKEQAVKEQMEFEGGKKILVGCNAYQNPAQKMGNEIQLYPFLKTKVRKTLAEPILGIRVAEQIEKKRLGNE